MMWYDLRVGRQANAGDLGNLAEESVDSVLVGVERQVTDEQSLGLGANGVTVLLGAVLGTSLVVAVAGGLLAREVDVHGAASEVLSLGGLESGGSGLRVAEVDVAEATAAASLLVGDDAGTGQVGELLEGLVEGVVIDSPGKGANEEGRALVGDVGAGLLARDDGVIQGLALLGGLLGLGLSLRGFLRVGVLLLLIGVRRVRVGVGVGRLSGAISGC